MALQLSGLVSGIKKTLVEIEGKVTRSEFYLTNIATNEMIQLCMTPQEVKARTEANFRTFNIIERGEVKLPKGEQLTQISWQGILPGARILLYPFVTHAAWEQPIEIIKALKRWREEGAKLKLLITQTPINLDVFIKSFDYTASGGQGNYEYNIDFIAAKELKILTVAEADEARAKAKENSIDELNRRAAMKSKLGMKVGKINNLWTIAQILTGNGGNWEKVLEQNPQITDPTSLDPNDMIIWG